MNARPDPSLSTSSEAGDWLDALLMRDAAEHADDYISDAGFTSAVMGRLPAPAQALPAWRRPFVTVLWLIAVALAVMALPATAIDIARGAFKLFAGQPFSLSGLVFAIVAVAVATWTAAAMALRRD